MEDKIKKIKEGLKDLSLQKVEVYLAYLNNLWFQIDKDKKPVNQWWLEKLNADKFIFWFKKIDAEGLAIDGKHITINQRGLSLDYVAYKNKMLLVYPESRINFGVVYKDDTFNFEEKNGEVIYQHIRKNPFNKKDDDVIGAYCIIRNNRGNIIKIMDRAEIDKHRKIASTDMMWNKWFEDMVLKTVIKKACKVYFDDIVEGIDDVDNQDIDLDLPIGADLLIKQEIEKIKNIEDLAEYQQKNKITGENLKLITKKFRELENANN